MVKPVKRGKRWVARPYADGRQLHRTFEFEWEARAWIATVETSVASGSWIDPAAGDILVEDWVRQRLERRHLAPRTKASQLSILESQIAPRFQGIKLNRLRPSHIEAAVQDMIAEGRSAGHATNMLNILRGALAVAVRDRLIPNNPATNVERPKVRKRPPMWLTPSELARLISKLEPHWRLMVEFAGYTGLRRGELWTLTVGQVDPLRAEVRVGSKTDAGYRTIPIPEWLIEPLKAHMAGKNAGDLMWPGARDGVISSRWVANHFKPALRAADLDPSFRLHDLRHTYATWLISQGVDVVSVSRVLGHSDPTTTLRVYAHLYRGNTEKVLSALRNVRVEEGDGPASTGRVIGL